MKRLIYILLCMILFTSCYENIIEDDLSKIQEGFDIPKTEKTEQYEIRSTKATEQTTKKYFKDQMKFF